MKKSVHKIISAILVIILATTLIFTGCSGQDSNEKKQESTQGQTQAQEQTQAKPADGKVYTYLWNSRFTVNDDAWTIKYLKDKFNIIIKPVRIEEDKKMEMLNILLASGVVPDYLYKNSIEEMAELQKAGVLAEVSESFIKENMPKYYDIVVNADPLGFKYGYIDGKNYALPIIDWSAKYPRPVAIRADWLTNVGAGIPKTLDELEAVLMKFRNDDPDKNGKKDTYGLTAAISEQPETSFQTIFGAFGVNPYFWKVVDGKLVYGFTSQGTKDALKVLNKWYKAGLIDPEFITDKFRTNANDDISYKFASGRIGYFDNLTADDHQWDNDGQMNTKWVANSPEWQKFFEDNKNDPEKCYATKNFFLEIPTNVPQPVYVNVNPPVGPGGESGSTCLATVASRVVFGKNLEKDKEKFAKLLQVLETMATDKDVLFNLIWGPEGHVWIKDANGRMMNNPDWTKSPYYEPNHSRKLGNQDLICPFAIISTDNAKILNTPRTLQRFDNCYEIVSTSMNPIRDALTVALPSQAKYPDLKSNVTEYIVKAITGSEDIDATFDNQVEKWMKGGGEVLTKEANEWYSNLK